ADTRAPRSAHPLDEGAERSFRQVGGNAAAAECQRMQSEERIEVLIVREAQAVDLSTTLDQPPEVPFDVLPLLRQVRKRDDVRVARRRLPPALQEYADIADCAAALQDHAVESERRQVIEQHVLDFKIARGFLRRISSVIWGELRTVVVQKQTRTGMAASQERSCFITRDATHQAPGTPDADYAKTCAGSCRESLQVISLRVNASAR